MVSERHNSRGRIGKAGRGAARGMSIRGASSRGASRGRARPPLGPRTTRKELLPDLIKSRKASPSTSGPVNVLGKNPPHPAQDYPQKPTGEELSVPRVERIYNDIWASGPASFAFVTHGKLDHSEDTIVIASNIIDHIIRPEHWNPELSNNKLSASCFFFASKLTNKKATATQVAGSIWMDPNMVAGMSQVNQGPLFDRMLESLAVSAAQVVEGYEILYEQREGIKDLLGEYGEEIAKLPLPAAEKLALKSEPEEGPYTSQVAAEMKKLGYRRGLGRMTGKDIAVPTEEGNATTDVVEAQDVAQLKSAPEDAVDWNNDFEDFVAENE